MKRLLRWLTQIDAHERVGVFSGALLFAVIVFLVSGRLVQADQKSNELWAKDGGTAVAAKDSYGTR